MSNDVCTIFDYIICIYTDISSAKPNHSQFDNYQYENYFSLWMHFILPYNVISLLNQHERCTICWRTDASFNIIDLGLMIFISVTEKGTKDASKNFSEEPKGKMFKQKRMTPQVKWIKTSQKNI